MNLKDTNNHCDCDGVCYNKSEENCSLSLTTSSNFKQNNLVESCRKRPPGGISMYSTGTTDIIPTTSSSLTSTHSASCHNKKEDTFIMNGTENNQQWKLNSTPYNNDIYKRKLKDDNVSANQVRKSLGRSDSENEKNRKLLTWHQIPTHLRFNRFVLSHYRAPTNWKGCLMSLGYMHNETINILTHAIPLVCIIAFIPWLLPYEYITIPYLPTFHVIASLAPWIGSILYHLFMNHEKGNSVYEAVLTIDLLGIWTTQTTGGLITICSTIYCFDNELQEQLLTAYGFLCLFSFYKAMNAHGAWARRFAFVAPFLVRMSMVFLRTIGRGGGHSDSFVHVLLQDLISIVGAIIGATNIPERWFPPGSCDLLCNSHHVMHVLVVYAVYQMHTAAVLDLTWMSEIQQNQLTCSNDTTALPSVQELFGYV